MIGLNSQTDVRLCSAFRAIKSSSMETGHLLEVRTAYMVGQRQWGREDRDS